jgi:2-dehydropantoate 2-reductase
MRENGLKLLFGEEAHVVQPRCTDNPIELGAQDFVIICFKAHSIPLVLDQMRPLLGPRTRIVTAVNGIPYWYFYRHGGAYENAILDSVDPGARQCRELGPDRAIGCIIYPATDRSARCHQASLRQPFSARRALRRDHGRRPAAFPICSPPPV